MEYTVTEISPVAIKVDVKVPAEEASGALTAAAAMYKMQTDVRGFRKGKAPVGLIESRFKKQIVSEATNDLLNVHINEILGEMKMTPLSGIEVDAGLLSKGEDFAYSFTFERAPVFDVPDYIGLEVEEEQAVCDAASVDQVVERVRSNAAELIPVADHREPVDGDVASVSFEAFENGEPVPGVRAENFQLTLGEGQALPEFETLVKTVKSGSEGSGQMTFPADFINQALAGKTVDMKVAVHVIKEKRLPPVDDDLARKAGNFENMEAMRAAIAASYEKNRQNLHKSAAQKKLLDQLLSQVEFPLPPAMVGANLEGMYEEFIDRLERQGKSLEGIGRTVEELRGDLKPKAEELAKVQILLLAVAAKEDLKVAPTEIDAELNRIAGSTGQDLMTVKQMYEQRNMIVPLKDRLLADKAMEAIYAKAKIVKIPAKAPEEEEAGQA